MFLFAAMLADPACGCRDCYDARAYAAQREIARLHYVMADMQWHNQEISEQMERMFDALREKDRQIAELTAKLQLMEQRVALNPEVQSKESQTNPSKIISQNIGIQTKHEKKSQSTQTVSDGLQDRLDEALIKILRQSQSIDALRANNTNLTAQHALDSQELERLKKALAKLEKQIKTFKEEVSPKTIPTVVHSAPQTKKVDRAPKQAASVDKDALLLKAFNDELQARQDIQATAEAEKVARQQEKQKAAQAVQEQSLEDIKQEIINQGTMHKAIEALRNGKKRSEKLRNIILVHLPYIKISSEELQFLIKCPDTQDVFAQFVFCYLQGNIKKMQRMLKNEDSLKFDKCVTFMIWQMIIAKKWRARDAYAEYRNLLLGREESRQTELELWTILITTAVLEELDADQEAGKELPLTRFFDTKTQRWENVTVDDLKNDVIAVRNQFLAENELAGEGVDEATVRQKIIDAAYARLFATGHFFIPEAKAKVLMRSVFFDKTIVN